MGFQRVEFFVFVCWTVATTILAGLKLVEQSFLFPRYIGDLNRQSFRVGPDCAFHRDSELPSPIRVILGEKRKLDSPSFMQVSPLVSSVAKSGFWVGAPVGRPCAATHLSGRLNGLEKNRFWPVPAVAGINLRVRYPATRPNPKAEAPVVQRNRPESTLKRHLLGD